MDKPFLYILEPSKVGIQHLTLLESYLQAFSVSKHVSKDYNIQFIASKKTIDRIDSNIFAKITYKEIYVINPDRKKVVSKTIVEIYQVLRMLLRMRHHDRLFVTCLLPTSLIVIELINRFLNKSGISVVLHGEIESLFNDSEQSVLKIGWWARLWNKVRHHESKVDVIVIDDFIKEKVDDLLGAGVKANVIHHPIRPIDLPIAKNITSVPKVGFIGYRTLNKGFSEYLTLVDMTPNCNFVAIGGGFVEDIRTTSIKNLDSYDDYIMTISSCDVAIFPYTKGYEATLSAAALDAISVGLPILAFDRPFFVNANKYFGDNVVSIIGNISEASLYLDTLHKKKHNKTENLKKIEVSKYAISSVAVDIDNYFGIKAENKAC